jgi:hypothetical protein
MFAANSLQDAVWTVPLSRLVLQGSWHCNLCTGTSDVRSIIFSIPKYVCLFSSQMNLYSGTNEVGIKGMRRG